MPESGPGRKIGRYQVLGELGRGAMGVVYRAEDPTIGRTVALKTTRVDVQGSESDELLKRLKQEARAAGVLNHPNIVTIYDAGEQDGLFYLAMEYVEGETLQSVLSRRRVLPLEEVIDNCRQICSGLDYAHQRGIIHRDIKPANIMVTPEGVAKIMDFGIAKAGVGMTTAGQVLGTPSYMSPEQVRGQPLDGRSDLFSMGVILYECVTGQKPFTVGTDSITSVIYKIVHEVPLPPRQIDASVPPDLNAAITRALAKAPADRFQRGAELAQALADCKTGALERARLGDEPTLIGPLPAAPGPPPPAMAGAAAAARPAMQPITSGKITEMYVPAYVPAAVHAPKPEEPAPPAQAAQPAPQPASSRRGLPGWVLVALVVVLGLAAVMGLVSARRARRDARLAAQAAREVAQQAPAAAQPELPPKPSAAVSSTAEAEAGAAPATGELKVVSTPEGASITVDGKLLRQQTPATVPRLAPGSHTVVVAKDGYRSETRTVEVRAGGREEIAAQLAGLLATVSVNSDPPGAIVTVDGTPLGQLTPAQVTLPEGAHAISVHKEGFRPARTAVNLRAGETYNYAPQLRAGGRDNPIGVLRKMFGGPGPRGFLLVQSDPPGAQVLVDGAALPRFTPVRVPLKVGTYRVAIRMQTYRVVEREITIEKDKVLQVSEKLQRQ